MVINRHKRTHFQLFFMFITMAVYSQTYSIEFNRIVYDGDLYNGYINKRYGGPCFLDNTTVIFANENESLVTIDLGTNEITTFELPDGGFAPIKINNQVIVLRDKGLYEFDGSEFTPHIGDLHLVDNIYFSFFQGLYKLVSGYKSYILVDGNRIPARSIFGIPVLSSDKKSIYFCYQTEDHYGSLYKYSIATGELSLINDHTGSFALMPDGKILANTYDGKHAVVPKLFHSDFSIFDEASGALVYNSDSDIYKSGSEYTINTFDINDSGQIIAFGAFLKVANGVVSEFHEPVMLLELDYPISAEQSNDPDLTF